MERNVLKQAAKYSKERRRKTRRNKALSALAAVVVFCTTYALILPAVTMEHQPTCGLEEHQHDESCYAQVLVCGEEESEGHTHDSSCYTIEVETEEVLVCSDSDEDHVHDSSCYETVETEFEVLTCDLEETSGHQHSDACYELQLVCGLAEHTHDDILCYGKESVNEDDALSKDDALNEDEVLDEVPDEDETPDEEAGLDDVLDELDEDAVLDENDAPDEAVLPTLEETYESDWYSVRFTAEVNSEELAGLDDLELIVTGDSDPSGDLFYAYCTLIEDDTLTPLERIDFELTSGGETIDRSLYTVYAQIIPSEDLIAYLGQMSEAVSVDLFDEENGEPGMPPIPALAVYEIADGELVKLSGAAGGDYVVEVEVTGDSFAVFAELTENPLETLEVAATDRYRQQGWWWWNDRYNAKVWWAGFVKSGEGIASATARVTDVTLTTLNGRTPGALYTIQRGDGTDKGTSSETGILLTDVFPKAEPKSNGQWLNEDQTGFGKSSVKLDQEAGEAFMQKDGDGAYSYVECDAFEATHIRATINEGYGFYDIGMQPKEQWEAKVNSLAGIGWAKDITYYKKALPDTPKEGHQYAQLDITPEPGYYVTSIVITCANNRTQGGWEWVWSNQLPGTGDAYHNCNTFAAGDAFRADFDISSGGSVSIVLDSEDFCHNGSISDKYFIMISTAPIPSPLYLAYDAGIMNDVLAGKDWLATSEGLSAVGNYRYSAKYGNPGQIWTESTLPVPTISDVKAENQTVEFNGKTYKFTGWKLERYETFEERLWDYDADNFQDQYGQSEDVKPGETIKLRFHTKLVAQWKEVTEEPDPIPTPPTTYTLDLEKVTTSGGQSTPQDPSNSDWSWLSGAEFQILDSTGKVIADLKPNNAGSGAKAETSLDYDVLYKLVETKAPTGYNMLDHVIYFMVWNDNGSNRLKVVSVNSNDAGSYTKEEFEKAKDSGTETNYYNAILTPQAAQDQATLTMIIANYGGYVLPSTGGPGVNWMYALGSALAAAAAATLVYKKSEGKEDCA